MKSGPPWNDAGRTRYPRLRRAARFDVIVVGAGITGLTAAYLLKKAGRKVCVLERDKICSGDTGCTTAHLTYATDTRLPRLARTFGKERARVAWQGGMAAIETIAQIVHQEAIDCEFCRVPGFLHAAVRGTKDETRSLRRDAELARELGFAAVMETKVPFFGKPGVRFSDQAKFHPLKYLHGLAALIEGDGSAVFKGTEVEEIHSEPVSVRANGWKLQGEFVVIATHVPLQGDRGTVGSAVFRSKLASYSTYAIGARTRKWSLPEALFWDTSEPYYYLRVDRRRLYDYVIFGGEDHKTGHADTPSRFQKLQQTLRELVPSAKIDRTWSGQVVETNDGLPFIGEIGERQFVATGFAGNGMTFGTLAGMMACDAALKRDNPWKDLLEPSRTKLRGGTWDYLKENFDYPYYLVRDRLTTVNGRTSRSLKRGEGIVRKVKGERIASSRDSSGKVVELSAECPHMGCIVHWNKAEKTWDCPCHGSRFQATGEVMAGPAASPLEAIKPLRQKARLR